jgi:anaerobic selenocysteine-containing dehydrogenase
MTRHFATCPLCEATCGLAIETDGNAIVDIRGDDEDPFSKGFLCPKAVALKDLHEDPERLRQPVRKTANGFEPMAWNDALDLVAERISDIRARHGKHAFGLYLGNPTVHSLGALTLGQVFLRAVPTKNRFSATSADQLPHQLAAFLMFGHQLALPVPDVDRTDFFLIIGGNPVASNGSLMTAPNMPDRLRAIRARGGEVVTVDPRRTETAALASQHLFIRPGTDAFLLLGMLQVILKDKERALPGVDGVSVLKGVTRDFAPSVVAPLCGIEAAVIQELASRFARAPRAVAYGRMGACTQEFGGVTAWLINCLNVVTKNIDRPGGAMFPKPAADLRAVFSRLGQAGSFRRYYSRVTERPAFSGELPVSAMAEEIETPGERQIRALLTHAGNPVLSTPNGRRLSRALETLEFMVSIDIYVNETTRHADVILPPTVGLSRDHYDLAFGLLSVRNVAKWSPAIFARDASERHDWEIFRALAQRLYRRQGVKGRLAALGLGALTPARMLDVMLRSGPYRQSVAKLKAHPHGLDLGPLTPQLPGLLATEDKKIDLCPEPFLEDLKRLRARMATVATPGIRLIGRRHLRSNNSWMHKNARLMKGKPRLTLLIHPDDAARHGFADGALCQVQSRAGAVVVPVQITTDMMPGVVSVPHGFGNGSLNDVTDELAADALSGNACLNGTPVTLSAATAFATSARL